MTDTKMVTVTKLGGAPPTDPVKKQDAGRSTRKVRPPKRKPDLHKKPKFGILKKGKTARNKPRFEAVRDPTSAPPLRILTHKGEKTRRNTIAEEVKKMPIHKIRETLRRNKLPVSSKNDALVRDIYAGAREAGMLSDA
jgi:hypothetical protein